MSLWSIESPSLPYMCTLFYFVSPYFDPLERGVEGAVCVKRYEI